MSQSHICVPEGPCTVGTVLEQLSSKWTIGVVLAAARGPIRFTELERELTGISRRMLTLTLRNLERDGLIDRTVYPTVPPKVEYTLTEVGRDFHESFAAMHAWAERNQPAINAARAAYTA
ncbi:helix-turn-helix domain-containing protein [Actinocrispum sp. NPDC049592]|uniref:winged helix-turn-helix transcriptional regulator n=1 Tax=Actinocrispum sp. NPDC049592 TaxID=3154835 RepID=UPI00341F914D